MKTLTELGVISTPWSISRNDSCMMPVDIESKGGIHFASVNSSHADARLIAAAPDLYEALRKLLVVAKNRMPSQPTVNELEVLVEADNALAKAVGEEANNESIK